MLKCENIIEVIDFLIGDILPVGHTETDNEAYDALIDNMSPVIHNCVEQLIECAQRKDSVAYSISRNGGMADSILRDLKEQIDDYFEG